MKTSKFLMIAALAMPLILSSCASKKKAVVQEQPLTAEQRSGLSFIERVKDNAVEKKFITSKVKFSVEVGAQKLTLTIISDDSHQNHWDFWVYPKAMRDEELQTNDKRLVMTASVDSALELLKAGCDVLLCAAGQIRYGADVVHRFLPVFWNTSWFKMKPPHTTGAYIQAQHPVFSDFPTDDWQDLQWWELTNRAQCMNLAEFPKDYQPIVQPIDTWHLSRKLGMMLEARVLCGRLFLTTLDITSDLGRRIVARQLRYSILRYMSSSAFQPTLKLEPVVLRHLFERDAPAVNMFTNDSPDELKPKFQ